MTEVQKQVKGGKTAFSTNDWSNWTSVDKKINLDLNLTSCKNINSKLTLRLYDTKSVIHKEKNE